MRATMSTGPPGAVGRTRRIGLVGKLCAWPAIAYARPQANAATVRTPTRSNVGGFVTNALPTSCMTSVDDDPFPHSIQLPSAYTAASGIEFEPIVLKGAARQGRINEPSQETPPRCDDARLLRDARRLRRRPGRGAARLDDDRRRAPGRERQAGGSGAVLRRPRRRRAARGLGPFRRFPLRYEERVRPRRERSRGGARGTRGRFGLGVLPAHPHRSGTPSGDRVALARPADA